MRSTAKMISVGNGGLKMTIDEAIAQAERIAEGQEKSAELSPFNHAKERISKSAAEHRQFAEWLRELQEYRADDWKKVEEDLPKAWYQVLVYRAKGIIEMAMYTGKLWLSITQKPIKDVAYWKYTKEPKGERLDDMLELIGGEDNDDRRSYKAL